MRISLQQISKNYKDCSALSNISMEINEGELIALLGPSGSGKTTLLKIIAGLERPCQGQVLINDVNVTKLSPKDRQIGFVFQHYALFKHMTIFENVSFGLKVQPSKTRLDKQAIEAKVKELLTLVQIEKLADRYPHELSGGQKQRVALARALAVEPKILLLDEPFAALDAKLKLELRRWLRILQKQTNITIILVTHDQEEALDVADKVMILNEGSIEQIGDPKTVYHSPANTFVYNFLSHYNIFDAVKDSSGKVSIRNKQTGSAQGLRKWNIKQKIVSSLSKIFKENKTLLENSKEYFEIFVRPHDMEVLRNVNSDEYIYAKISHINLAGPIVKLELESKDYELIQVEMPHEQFKALELKKGEPIYTKAREFTMFE